MRNYKGRGRKDKRRHDKTCQSIKYYDSVREKQRLLREGMKEKVIWKMDLNLSKKFREKENGKDGRMY